MNLAVDAMREMREVIEKEYGKEGVAEEPRIYKTKSRNAQEAHEAIRPTSAAVLPSKLEGKIDPDQFKLYALIWKRAVASQMAHALFDTVAVDMVPEQAGRSRQRRRSGRHVLRANGSTLVKPGYMAVYQEDVDDGKPENENDRILPAMKDGDVVTLLNVHGDQHFTEPPPRFSEASLVKALEEHGIGRPSTYATIISTLKDREYVDMDNRRFIPTDIGKIVGSFLSKHFHKYVEYGFTAALEDELDAVSRGEENWTEPLKKFWKPFITQVEHIEKNVSREEVAQARELGKHPESGKPITVRMGRFGPFVQIGTKDDEEKPKFAGLRPGQKMDLIKLPEALELFKLPVSLGDTADGEPVQSNIGRFGPYIKYGAKYVSLKPPDDPYTVDARARARSHPPQEGSGCQPHHPGLRRRQHPGAERPLRPVHHRRQAQRAHPEGHRSEIGARSSCAASCSPSRRRAAAVSAARKRQLQDGGRRKTRRPRGRDSASEKPAKKSASRAVGRTTSKKARHRKRNSAARQCEEPRRKPKKTHRSQET